MVQFNSLRLGGFKSFVDPTDLVIAPGLTGVVGPNGCGKSNLVEALRWVMGENSAKRMRGSEMDDVIFSGTASRPARNLADVTLQLDNRDRTAPAIFNDFDQLEVVRRITRGQGSSYRVNGKEVRARDVQLLFADAASGAHSTALVSQGQIGALINAKATDRRGLLEEAAGITGLHSRRHEAELRLRAAETNLERLDDVIATLEAQLQGLKKQARQATRYRNINVQIRRLEAISLHCEAGESKAALASAESDLASAEQEVGRLAQEAAAAAREQAEAAEGLPALRQAEAEAAAALQRQLLDRESLEREIERATNAKADAEARLAQIESDRERARTLAQDAEAAQSRLAEERNTLKAAEGEEQAARSEAEREVEAATTAVTERETALEKLTDQVATDEAKATSLARQVEVHSNRLSRLRSEIEEHDRQRAALESQRLPEDELERGTATLAAAETRLDTARKAAVLAGEALAEARAAEEAARSKLRAREDTCAELEAEAKALVAVLEAGEPDMWPAMVDALTVEPGYEAALGAALGDDLTASSDEAAPLHWETLPPYAAPPALPSGVAPLSNWVAGPPALTRRLGQIGVVEDEATGHRHQSDLEPGQRLVSREAALWRWDGFTAKAEAPTAAAVRLAQRNRLAELRGALDGLLAEREAAKGDHAAAGAEAEAAGEREKAAREAVSTELGSLDETRRRQAQLEQRAAGMESRLSGLETAGARLLADLSDCENQLSAAESEREALPPLDDARAQLFALRSRLAEERSQLGEWQGKRERLTRDAASRGARLLTIADEYASWQKRGEDVGQHLDELASRDRTVTEEIDHLSELPEQLKARGERLAGLIDAAEAKRKAAGDALALGETRQREADKTLKSAEQLAGGSRERRVRTEADVEHAQQSLELVVEKIAERLECGLDEVLENAGIGPEESLPSREEVESKLQRLQRERDNIGPVNLRAEAEVAELDLQISSMHSERGDLVAAIARLRQGISSLNREGRARLLAAFETVNGHFSELFVRLFGGGRAHLRLTEAEDPLDAGLEIMASPPGKRLQVMSLLSGGEQALTALSLLFAVFLTNPAPICVLDEVDAPLDDANVDRLCTLLDELTRGTSTRFLVITHHRMTMSRVDRLFGVTMSERGVSQLVSVDLETATSLREIA